MQYYTGLLIGVKIQIGLFKFHCRSYVPERSEMLHLSHRSSVQLVALSSFWSMSCSIFVHGCRVSWCDDIQLIWYICNSCLARTARAHEREVLASCARCTAFDQRPSGIRQYHLVKYTRHENYVAFTCYEEFRN